MDRKENMPLWVWFGLVNFDTRKGAMWQVWIVFALSVASVPYWYFFDGDWVWMAMMFPTWLYYWLGVRWVDRHSSWDGPESPAADSGE